MKLSEFHRVAALMRGLEELQDKLTNLPKGLGVTLSGHDQDDAFVAAVLPSVRAELHRRIKEFRDRLVKAGVDTSR